MKANDVVIGWVRKTAEGSTDELIQLETRSWGEVIEWHHITARNDSDNTTLIEIGLKRNTDEFLLRASAQGAVGRTVHTEATILATGDYHPYARFSDPDAGDILELFGFGHLITPLDIVAPD